MILSIINLWKRKIIKMWFSTKCQAVPDLTKAKTWPFHRYVYTFHPFALYISAFTFHACFTSQLILAYIHVQTPYSLSILLKT